MARPADAPRGRAMVLARAGEPLRLVSREPAEPGPGQVRLAVAACGVCRTDLHLRDGDLPLGPGPRVLGHEVVGRVEALGPGVDAPAVGSRVGLPWLGRTCGRCAPCRAGRENLCDEAAFTGWQLDGGFASHVVARADACLPLPDAYDDVSAAPLLCAGLIGWRSLRAAGDPRRLGLYGFGAAAHIVAQVARAEGRDVLAFTRPGDHAAQAFARGLGAAWAGGSDEPPPEPLDAAILFAPVGALVPAALSAVRKGGVVVCAGIHMSDLPSFPYALLWGERVVRSVANLTRRDGREFLARAPQVPVRTETTRYALDRADEALDDLAAGRVHGAAVLVP